MSPWFLIVVVNVTVSRMEGASGDHEIDAIVRSGPVAAKACPFITGMGIAVIKPVIRQTNASTPSQARCFKELIVYNLHVSVTNSILPQIGNRLRFNMELEIVPPPIYKDI